MRLPRWLARFNKLVTNRVMGLWAPYLPPWAVVVHRGRKTGRTYRTVLWAFPRNERLVIALTYGDTDWSRNVLAAGGGQIVWRGEPVASPTLGSSATHTTRRCHREPDGRYGSSDGLSSPT